MREDIFNADGTLNTPFIKWLVDLAVRRGWCSQPQKMRPTTSADYARAKKKSKQC